MCALRQDEELQLRTLKVFQKSYEQHKRDFDCGVRATFRFYFVEFLVSAFWSIKIVFCYYMLAYYIVEKLEIITFISENYAK